MRIKNKNVKRLASLSAFGAGALAATVANANAGVIYATNVNQTVGFASGDLSSYSIPLDTNALTLAAVRNGSSLFAQFRVGLQPSGSRTVLQTQNFSVFGGTAAGVRLFNAGQAWPASAPNAAGGDLLVALRSLFLTFGYPGASFWGNRNGSHGYALFKFQGLSGANYGWLELSVAGSTYPYPGSGPEVTVNAWAYGNNGEQLAAGQTAVVPEPASFMLTGLGALVLGAAGVRRWRAARKTA